MLNKKDMKKVKIVSTMYGASVIGFTVFIIHASKILPLTGTVTIGGVGVLATAYTLYNIINIFTLQSKDKKELRKILNNISE